MKPNAPILVSASSFWLWFMRDTGVRRFEILLSEGLLEDLLIDGIEIPIAFDELSEWSRHLSYVKRPSLPGRLRLLSPGLQERLLRLRFNSAHLPPLKLLPSGRTGWLIKRLIRIAEHTQITEFTVHPDEVKRDTWRRLLEALPENLVLSVENMDGRKNGFQALTELEALLEMEPRLSLTFDLCHWLDIGKSSDDPELLNFLERYRSRIQKLHFSVPRSANAVYGDLGKGIVSHFLAANSGVKISQRFFDALPSGVKWVSEGIVPPAGVKLLKAELYELHRLAQHTTANRKIAAG